jgi:hypothetical protein
MSSLAADANVELEQELHHARLTIVQLEAQRDFLLDRVVALESAERLRAASPPRGTLQNQLQRPVLRLAGAPSAKKRLKPSAGAAPETPDAEDRTGMCIATLKSGKMCRRKQSAVSSYCGYHSPLDPRSGQVYCSHNSTRGKHCGNPVPVGGDGLCKYHKDSSAVVDNNNDSDDYDSD